MDATRWMRSLTLAIARPFRATMISPKRMPDWLSGLPATVSRTSAPLALSRPSEVRQRRLERIHPDAEPALLLIDRVVTNLHRQPDEASLGPRSLVRGRYLGRLPAGCGSGLAGARGHADDVDARIRSLQEGSAESRCGTLRPQPGSHRQRVGWRDAGGDQDNRSNRAAAARVHMPVPSASVTLRYIGGRNNSSVWMTAPNSHLGCRGQLVESAVRSCA